MRQINITTNGKDILIVDLPRNAEIICVAANPLTANPYLAYKSNGLMYRPELPFKCEPVGFALSLSEKEWAGILDHTPESGKYWLEANGIADFKNPFLLIKK